MEKLALIAIAVLASFVWFWLMRVTVSFVTALLIWQWQKEYETIRKDFKLWERVKGETRL